MKFKNYLRFIWYCVVMPSKNRVKVYMDNGYYHIYNRGVEKRLIFLDAQDYAVFLSYLKEYLSIKDERKLRERLADPTISYKERAQIIRALRLNNFYGEIILISYALMTNHIHLLLKQTKPTVIDSFMQSLFTRYSVYFNRKYQRVGGLCQGAYKAVLVETEEQLLHLTRYIHKQSLASKGQTLRGYGGEDQPSSYPEYLGLRKAEWVHLEEILSYFSRTNPKLSYQNFVEDQDDLSMISKLILED